MNITILANKDIASNYALNLLLPHLSDYRVSIFLSSKIGAGNKTPARLKHLKFFEQDLFDHLIWDFLPPISERETNFRSFNQLNALLCNPIQILNEINAPEGLAILRDCSPDIVISIRYGVILKANAIAIPRQGVINLHSGLLPKYRGVMATFWAMLNEETEIGSTLHFISDGNIDTGNIINISRLKVDRTKSYLWHILELYKGGCELVLDAIIAVSQGQEPGAYAQPDDGNYFTFPSEVELTDFEERLGLSLVNEQEIIDFVKSNYH